jgi:putative DNA primase/helicase
MPLQCENCGEDKITVEQFKQGVTKCPECMRERTKQLCAESDARRKRLRAAKEAAEKAQPNESLNKGDVQRQSVAALEDKERDARKVEAFKPVAGRAELGHWANDIEVRDGRDTITIQHVIKVSSINAASVKPKDVDWLWFNRIPAGAITYGVGKPGNAKSLWSTDLAARVSSGADFPDCKNEHGAQKVLLYAGEDSLENTVIPRLIRAGANLANIELLDNSSFEVYDRDYNRVDRRGIDLSQDIAIIGQLIKKHPDIRLLIIDPITGVFGNRNTNHDKDMRPIMNELKDMLEARGLTLVGIAHTNKRGDAAAIDQIQGASSIAGAARAAWLFTRDSESDDEHAHMMTCIKGNLSDNHDGLKLLTVAEEVPGLKRPVPSIVWGESTKMQADEANQALKEKRETKGGKRNAAKLGILAIIAEKPMLSDDVYTALEKQGFSGETVKRAASELTKEFQIHRKQRGGRWYMVLAEHLYEFEQETEAEVQPEAVMALSATEAL